MEDRIVIDPDFDDGEHMIHATWLPITIVIGSLAGGMTYGELHREYDITPGDIRGALRYVVELVE